MSCSFMFDFVINFIFRRVVAQHLRLYFFRIVDLLI